MSIRKVPEITAEQENARLVEMIPGESRFKMLKKDPVEPLEVGSYVAMVFRVTGYDQDCDGSLMIRAEQVDRHGETTGWEIDSIGLYTDVDVVLDGPGDLHALIEGDDA